MSQQELTYNIAQIIGSSAAIFMAAAKYRELWGFAYKLICLLGKPFQCVWRWIKLARKIEAATSENKSDIESLRKEISSLTAFVKEKLSPNGGSSPIDAIKRIENRQVLAEARSAAILNDSKCGIFFCDTLGCNTWANRTFARFLDCGTNELLGYGWKKFIRTEELTRYSKIWESAFKDGCEFDETVMFTTTHGGTVGLHISVSAVQNDKGETTSYIGQVIAL